jgi:hypothetical protein
LWLLGELQQALNEVVGIAGRHKKSCLVGDADFTRAVAVIGYDWLRGRECLRERAWQTFTLRQVNDSIHDRDESGDVLWWDEAGEPNDSLQALCGDGFLERSKQWSITDQKKFYFGATLDKDWGNAD